MKMDATQTDLSEWRAARRRYFLNGVVWSVLAVPIAVGMGVVLSAWASYTAGILEWFGAKPSGQPEPGLPMWSWLVAWGFCALAVLALLAWIFRRGWKITRQYAPHKGRLAACGVAFGGIALHIVMAAVYLFLATLAALILMKAGA